MSDRSWTCEQLTLPGLDSGTSSPASADGPTPSVWLASPMTPTSGPARVRASRSAPPASVADSTTPATSGPSGSGSSRSVALQSSLESRLRALTDSRGSTLYRLTWRERVTPLQRRICALRASGLRTSDSGCTSWPTPTTRDHKDGASVGTVPVNGLLGRAVWLAGWATPTASEKVRSEEFRRGREPNAREALVIPGDPPSGSPASTAAADRFQLNPHFSLWLQGYPTAWGVCAEAVTPSSRKSRRRS